MKQVLRAIAAARQDEVSIEVSGLDEFDIGDFSNELDDAKKLLELGIGSETLKKQVFKKLAFKYLCDARQEVKNRVAEEIDAGCRTRPERRELRSWPEAAKRRDRAIAAGDSERDSKEVIWKGSTFRRL